VIIVVKTYKITHDRQNCIGCGACAVIAPDFWAINDDGKAQLLKAESKPNGKHEKKIDQKAFDINLEAAESCPVESIHILDEESGDKVI
jgi:ferredoxin